MIFSSKIGRLSTAFALAALSVGTSCVKTDGTLGQDYIPSSHIWKVATASFDIEDVEMQRADELGGYSSKRIVIGAIHDNEFGWGERISAFTLIPLVDTLTFQMPEDAKCKSFHFAIAKDTLLFRDNSEERIIQSIRVHKLLKPLDNDILYSGKLKGEFYKGEEEDFRMFDSNELITSGVPTYNGGDSLSFDFKKNFGQEYLDALKGMKLGSLTEFTKKMPGIIMKADRSVGGGSGRLNLFQCAVATDDYNYLTGNYATLRFSATYDERGPIDTSMVVLVGMSSMIDSETSALPTQYAFNFSTSESQTASGKVSDKFLIEGGSGLKPVIRASVLKKGIEDKITAVLKDNIEGYSEMSESEQKEVLQQRLSQTIVNRATIILPYKEDYDKLDKYPKVLSPTCRIEGTREITLDEGSTKEQKIVTFAGLTDASVASENQGDINRSLNRYQPDISHHAQELIRLSRKEDENETEEEYAARMSNYDVWMLIMHPETTTTSSSGDSSYNDYLNALAYSSYYNNLYGYGGYGYGGYGYGYDSYYNNYYNYMMMAAYASQSSTTTTSSVDLDKDRYYNCQLMPPGEIRHPKMTITFSFPKE